MALQSLKLREESLELRDGPSLRDLELGLTYRLKADPKAKRSDPRVYRGTIRHLVRFVAKETPDHDAREFMVAIEAGWRRDWFDEYCFWGYVVSEGGIMRSQPTIMKGSYNVLRRNGVVSLYDTAPFMEAAREFFLKEVFETPAPSPLPATWILIIDDVEPGKGSIEENIRRYTSIPIIIARNWVDASAILSRGQPVCAFVDAMSSTHATSLSKACLEYYNKHDLAGRLEAIIGDAARKRVYVSNALEADITTAIYKFLKETRVI